MVESLSWERLKNLQKAALVKGLLPDATDQQEIVNKNTVDYSKDPVLELKNYSGYGFKDISLKVYPGEILSCRCCRCWKNRDGTDNFWNGQSTWRKSLSGW